MLNTQIESGPGRINPDIVSIWSGYITFTDVHQPSTIYHQPLFPANGNSTKKVVPFPTDVSNQILPLACSTIVLLMARPSPVPDDFVVKLGMNILDCICSGMPSPLSIILIRI